jgi:hypothetical protein
MQDIFTQILKVTLYALATFTTVILLAYIYCLYGKYQEQQKYKKFDSETKDRIMRTIVKR